MALRGQYDSQARWPQTVKGLVPMHKMQPRRLEQFGQHQERDISDSELENITKKNNFSTEQLRKKLGK